MSNVFDKVVDGVTDTFEKVSTPTSRSGFSVSRVANLIASGVHSEVIALQLTLNGKNEHKYTKSHIEGINMLYIDNKSKVAITAEQARALRDAQKNESVE